jgi:hypothetical protein
LKAGLHRMQKQFFVSWLNADQLPSSKKSRSSPEMTMLFWEVMSASYKAPSITSTVMEESLKIFIIHPRLPLPVQALKGIVLS